MEQDAERVARASGSGDLAASCGIDTGGQKIGRWTVLEMVFFEDRDVYEIGKRTKIYGVESVLVEVAFVKRNAVVAMAKKRGEEPKLVDMEFVGLPTAGGKSRADSPDRFDAVCDRTQCEARLQFNGFEARHSELANFLNREGQLGSCG